MKNLKELQNIKNVHWDVITQTSSHVFAAAGVQSPEVQAAVCFPRSKILGRAANPNINEGIVHLIHRIDVEHTMVTTAAGESGGTVEFQIRRRDPGAGAVDLLRSLAPIDEVAFEAQLWTPVAHSSTGTAGAQVFFNTNPHDFWEFKEPLVMVKPYYAKFRGVHSSAVAQTTSLLVYAYVLVESVRVSGKKYRQLLEEYTKMTANPVGTM